MERLSAAIRYFIASQPDLCVLSASLQHSAAALIYGGEKNVCVLGQSPVLLVSTTSPVEVATAPVSV